MKNKILVSFILIASAVFIPEVNFCGDDPVFVAHASGAGDVAVVGDWNGDGKAKVGIYNAGQWTLDYNGNGVWDGSSVDKTFTFGSATDQPVTGDWNGDGKTEIGNYKGNGTWALDYNGNGQWDGPAIDKLVTFGSAGDLPVTGDWNGDGKTEIGNYKGNGGWALDYNGNGQWDGPTIDKLLTFGAAGDLPVVGDWNGDGKTEVGNYKGNGTWALDYNGNGIWDGSSVDKLINYGSSIDQPVAGDWNGDGIDTLGIFDKNNGVFDLKNRFSGNTPELEYHFSAENGVGSSVEKTLDLTAQTTVDAPYCQGIIYSFNLPKGGVYFKGMSGYASMTPTEPVFTQSLVWAANIPDGNCPPNGSLYNSPVDGSTIYPETAAANVFALYILKSSDNKPVRVDTNFRLPEKIPMKGCVFVIVGGCGSRTTKLTSESHMSMIYDTAPSSSAAIPVLRDIAYESIFGWQVYDSQNKCNGNVCSADFAHSDRAFARAWKSDGGYQLKYLYGDVSGAGVTGLSSSNPPVNPPSAAWNDDFDYYLYKNCGNLPNAGNGPADFYSQIPADVTLLDNIHQETSSRFVPSGDKAFVFGSSTDLPVVGDWNAGGKDEAGNYKGNGIWAVDYNANYKWDDTTLDRTFTFGSSTDQPVTGDWNGDGKTEIGNYKGNGVWALDYNGNGVWDGPSADKLLTFGAACDLPITGDWNGDGKTEVGNYKGSGVWALDYNGNGVWDGPTIDKLLNFGSSTDQPVTGDWNGDGKTEVGNYKGSGVWALDYNGNGVWDGSATDKLFNFNVSGDMPVTGDWNGDGKTEIGNYSKSDGVWNLDYNGNGAWDEDNSGVDSFQVPIAKDFSSIPVAAGNCLVGLNRAASATGGAIDNESQVLTELVPTICQSQCVSGAKQCSGSGYQVCGDANSDGCTEWGNGIACAAGQSCASGACKSASNPTPSCVAKTCLALGNYQCGSWSDGCGQTLNCGSCTSGKTCNNGICVSSGGGTINPPTPPVIEKPAVKMTRAEILAKIAKIQALIADLKKQLAALTGSPSQNATANQSSTFSCTQITKNLFYGMANDPQVKCLQEVLKSQGYAVSASGNYDAATKTAVALFQQKYAGEILAPYYLTRGSGNVGNATRAKMNQIIGGK